MLRSVEGVRRKVGPGKASLEARGRDGLDEDKPRAGGRAQTERFTLLRRAIVRFSNKNLSLFAIP